MVKYLLLLALLVSCKESSEPKQEPPQKIKPLTKLNLKNIKSTKAGLKLLPKVKLQKAQNAIEGKDFEKALEIYDQIAKMPKLDNESRSQVFAGKANCYFYMKKYEEAVDSWEKVIAIRKNDTFPMRNLAFVYQEWGKPKKAYELLKKVLKKEPHILISRIDLIKLMEQLGFSKQKMKKEADLLYEKRNEMVKELKTEKLNKKKAFKYLGYLNEIPGKSELNTLEFSTLEPWLKHKSSLIRIRAAALVVKTAKGKEYLRKNLDNQKDPSVKKKWKKILKEN